MAKSNDGLCWLHLMHTSNRKHRLTIKPCSPYQRVSLICEIIWCLIIIVSFFKVHSRWMSTSIMIVGLLDAGGTVLGRLPSYSAMISSWNSFSEVHPLACSWKLDYDQGQSHHLLLGCWHPMHCCISLP